MVNGLRMKKFFLILLLYPYTGYAQSQADKEPDSVQVLENIIIRAYETNRRLADIPAPVNVVTQADLDRYGNATVIEAMNVNPGVRMDERSPGSYRLSIRGSSLRSPFGVRNVKVYYNGIPFTDPGGNTYLNQLDFYNYQSIEIIKGPAGSLYGAGTGGVLLVSSLPDSFRPGGTIAYTRGSYHTDHIHAAVRFGNEKAGNLVSWQHYTGNGYRQHTAMRRDVLGWDAVIKASVGSQWQAHFLWSDLYYQTPGALTLNEYELNPRAARPPAGMFPGADEAKAAIYQKNFLAGFSYKARISKSWQNETFLYGAYAQVHNPNFRNYSRTSEPHTGGRTVFTFSRQLSGALLTLHTGAEYQQSFNIQRVYDNNKGATGALQSDDEISNSQGFIFLQGNAVYRHGWTGTAGISFNRLRLYFTRLSDVPPVTDKRDFHTELTPRIALLKQMKSLSVYGSISRGFSAPTSAEILPSTNIFNTTLQAESGMNYEIGSRGYALKNRFYFDVNMFFYRLQHAIVQRRDASGGDYFDNAGAAVQNGLETYFSYVWRGRGASFFDRITCYASGTFNDFYYKDFKQAGNDYSGNRLPGVAPCTIATGIDAVARSGLYGHLDLFYSSRIALNDSNQDEAAPYYLSGVKVGYKKKANARTGMEFFAGVQNLFDETYSLGNDINAAGGRYYNAAAGRNYYAGIVFRWDAGKDR